MGCLYIIEFDNGKSYIGITSKTCESRLYDHEKNSRNCTKHTMLCKAMRAHREHYSARTLAVYDDWESLKIVERKAIIAYGTYPPKGYNLTNGGEGTPLTEDHKRRLSEIAKAAGWTPSSANKASVSRANTGNKYAVECNIGNKNAEGKRSVLSCIRIRVGIATGSAIRCGRPMSVYPRCEPTFV